MDGKQATAAPPTWPALASDVQQMFYPSGAPAQQLIGAERQGGGNGEEDELQERVARENEIVRDRSLEGMVIVTGFILISAIGTILFYAFVYSAFSLVHGYPSIGVSPGAPGPFLSQRYTAQWFLVYALSLNYALPALLALAIATPGRITAVFLHRQVTALVGLANAGIGLALLILYWIYCNGANATWNAMANDVAWCCVNAAKSAVATELCGAIDPLTCVPLRTASTLHVATPYLWSMLATIAFVVNAYFHFMINSFLPRWKLWSLRPLSAET